MGEYYNEQLSPITTQTTYVIVTTDMPVVTANQSDLIIDTTNRVIRNIPVISQPIQGLLLIVILIAAILTNSAIILNISRDSLKLRMVHFLLIRHVCITDSIGALFVLPVPMVSFIKGYWDWSDTACTIISTTTACCWTMHLVAVALYRADRVFAVWLPTGRYPLISARIVNGLLVLIWATALSGSYLATRVFTPAFQPALALCIPNVPIVFFILVFGCYCLGLIAMTTGYILVFLNRRKKRRRKRALQQQTLQSPNSKSAPNLRTDFTNNNLNPAPSPEQPEPSNNPRQPNPSNKSPRSVNFEESSTPSTSNQSCNKRPLTPPYVPSKPRPQTHRRVHSDGVQINAIIASSHESVLSVQYRTLSKRSHDSSEEYEHEHCVEESVAEKLDECDGVSGVVSSSNTTSDREQQDQHQNGQVASAGSRKRSRTARCRVIASYSVSIGHLILYLPAMILVALLGPKLPVGVAFVCGLVVYCEFIVQPIALLLVSPKLRNEVFQMVRSYMRVRPAVPNSCTSTPNFIPSATNEISSSAAAVVVIDEPLSTLPSSPDHQNEKS